MASNPQDVRAAALKEMARRELARRQQKPFVGPVATGEEMARSMQKPAAPKMGLLDVAALTAPPLTRAVAEPALAIGTSMVSSPVNHFWNAAMEAGRFPTGQPMGTYEPRTPEGKAVLGGIDKLTRMTGIPSLLEKGLDLDSPDPGTRSTGHAIAGTIGALPLIGRITGAAASRAAIPTRAAIKDAANAAYTRAEQAGGMLPQSNLGGFVNQAEQMLVKEGFDQQLNPKTYAAVQRFMDEATKPGISGHSPQGAEILRRVLLNAEKSAEIGSADARLAGKLVDEFDDFMDKQLPSSSSEYANARLLWQTNRKAQDIETLFERAQNQAGQYSVSGMENALRTQFKQLADNPRRFNRFNAAEKDAILKVVRGGPIQYGLRLLGKFAPTGTVPALASLAAEGVAPGAGIALAGAGIAGKAGASALRNRAARRVDELVRSGAIPAMPNARPGQPGLPQLGYLPANALAVQERDRPRNALAR